MPEDKDIIGEVIDDILCTIQNRADSYSKYEEDERLMIRYDECVDIMNFILTNYNEELYAYHEWLEITRLMKVGDQ